MVENKWFPVKHEEPKTIKEWIEICRKYYIGQDLSGGPLHASLSNIYNDIASMKAICAFALAIGDENPIYHDLNYAATTRYGNIIAPSTFPESIAYPAAPEAGPGIGVDLQTIFAGVELENYNVIRLNDSFKVEKKIGRLRREGW